MAFEYLSLALAGLAILLAAGYSASKSKALGDVPSGLPWVGLQSGIFSNLRTRIASLNKSLETIESGYRSYSKAGLSFVLPGFDRSMVLIPGSFAKWIAEQPSNILNAAAMQREVLQTEYSLLDPAIANNPIHEIVVRRDLTRQVANLIPETNEELINGVEDCWGNDTENWREIGVFETSMKIVARTSNRIFVGLPLCRNDDYLNNAAAYAQDVAISSSLLRLIPSFLRPFLGWICLLPNRWHHYKCSRYLLPFIRERIASLSSSDSAQPNDFTTWYLNEVSSCPDPKEKSPEMVVLRLMTINFAAIHTSTFTATNILFDLYSSPHISEYLTELRAEIEAAIEYNNGVWDKHAVARLIKLDSAIRESMRISTFLSHGMDRLVVDPKGVNLPGNGVGEGLHLPHGTRIGTSTYSIHHDDAVYENACTYDAFRFSRPFTSSSSASSSSPSSPTSSGSSSPTSTASSSPTTSTSTSRTYLEQKNLSTVTTSDTFLSFGHGRHACPGRFFAVMEMKLLCAYIIMNYDVKPLESRPPNLFLGGSILPPMKATLQVRRRRPEA